MQRLYNSASYGLLHVFTAWVLREVTAVTVHQTLHCTLLQTWSRTYMHEHISLCTRPSYICAVYQVEATSNSLHNDLLHSPFVASILGVNIQVVGVNRGNHMSPTISARVCTVWQCGVCSAMCCTCECDRHTFQRRLWADSVPEPLLSIATFSSNWFLASSCPCLTLSSRT